MSSLPSSLLIRIRERINDFSYTDVKYSVFSVLSKRFTQYYVRQYDNTCRRILAVAVVTVKSRIVLIISTE